MHKIKSRKSIIYESELPENHLYAKHIAVVLGGMSSEREVSIMSGTPIAASLVKMGYRVTKIDMGTDIAAAIEKVKPDIVFNALHGTFGEDGCLPGLLDIMGIPYTHSGVLASSVGMHKIFSRHIFESAGIKTPKWELVHRSNPKITTSKPYVVKPMSEGSSVGVIIVFEEDDFDINNYEWAYGDVVIVEEYIKGQEVQTAVLDNKAVGSIELRPNVKFYDYKAKYTDGLCEHIMPANIPEKTSKLAKDIAEKAHKLLGVRCLSRSDFRFNAEKGEDALYLLETNTHPGMTPLSLVPEICKYYNISFEDILQKLIESATCRN